MRPAMNITIMVEKKPINYCLIKQICSTRSVCQTGKIQLTRVVAPLISATKCSYRTIQFQQNNQNNNSISNRYPCKSSNKCLLQVSPIQTITLMLKKIRPQAAMNRKCVTDLKRQVVQRSISPSRNQRKRLQIITMNLRGPSTKAASM